MKGLEKPELAGLHREALARRAQYRDLLCAVVAGSVGKTSTKELLRALLARAFPQGAGSFHTNPGNLNTKSAIAQQLIGLPRSCTRAVFEVGARSPGDFAFPLSLIQPEVVALLNIGSAHLGEFGSRKALEREKLSALDCDTAKVLVVPEADCGILARALRTRKMVIPFRGSRGPEGIAIRAGTFCADIPVRFMRPGLQDHLAAAAAVAIALGVPESVLRSSLGEVPVIPGRYERLEFSGRPIIQDAFNSSPESLMAGLRTFAAEAKGRRVALVLGSMLELGGESEALHRRAGREIRELFDGPCTLITLGEEAGWLGEELGMRMRWRRAGRADEAARFLRECADWELAYVKGSRAMGLAVCFASV